MAVIALGADHAGFPLKGEVKAWLLARAWEVHDFGTTSEKSVDRRAGEVGAPHAPAR